MGGGYKLGDEIYFNHPTSGGTITIIIPNDSQYYNNNRTFQYNDGSLTETLKVPPQPVYLMLPKGSLKTTPDLLLNNITYGTDGNGSSLSSVTDGTYTVTINDGVSPFRNQ